MYYKWTCVWVSTVVGSRYCNSIKQNIMKVFYIMHTDRYSQLQKKKNEKKMKQFPCCLVWIKHIVRNSRGRDLWIYNYLCNHCLSPLILWFRISIWQGVLDASLCDNICQWIETGRWFSPVSSTNKNWPPQYSWNIVESGVNHHRPNQPINIFPLTVHNKIYYEFSLLHIFSLVLQPWMSAYIRKTDGVYISVPKKKLKHGRQNITLHWINGIIRNNKCIFTKLNAVFILKTAEWTKKYYNG